MPVDAAGLDYLLASPFRYGHTQASRFRRADEKPGIFYASEAEHTAIAEAAYWRLRFFSRSPGLSPPQTTSEHTSFSVKVAIARALDLTAKALCGGGAPIDTSIRLYCGQNLATEARKAGIELIRTLSARDPGHGCNIVLLAPSAFAERKPKHGKTWHMRFEANRLIVLAAFPHRDSYTFAPESFGFPASA